MFYSVANQNFLVQVFLTLRLLSRWLNFQTIFNVTPLGNWLLKKTCKKITKCFSLITYFYYSPLILDVNNAFYHYFESTKKKIKYYDIFAIKEKRQLIQFLQHSFTLFSISISFFSHRALRIGLQNVGNMDAA